MKTKQKFNLALLVTIAVLTFSCNPDVKPETQPGESTEKHSMGNPIIDPEDIQEGAPLPDLSKYVVVEKNTLHFKDIEALNLVADLWNHCSENSLNAWEKKVGYRSLRTANDEKAAADPNLDDSEFDKQRLPNPAMEMLFNENGEMVVAGQFLTIRDDVLREGQNGQVKNLLSDSCRFDKTVIKERINGDFKIVGTKWNLDRAFANEIGAKSRIFKKNSKGNWKIYKADSTCLLLDQWHHIEYSLIDRATLYTIQQTPISNIRKCAKNQSYVTKIFARNPCINCDLSFCVPQFGRVHHWFNGFFNLDAHTEAWEW